MRRVPAVIAALLATGALASCGSSTGGGSVSVLYAGSLVNLMERDLGPAFTASRHYGFRGVGAGSTELVAQIKGRVRQGDVFISASPQANSALEGNANGGWATWYVIFARAPLVIGYNPHSRFASQFAGRPWYEVITQPGIRVGRTDPALDPKGKLTVKALAEAGRKLHLPGLAPALARFAVFPEESLVGRLQTGQLDAGFFYANEAREQHIPAVALAGVSESATYTATILSAARNPGGAQAFLAFLLGPSGRAVLAAHGLTNLPGRLVGDPATVPAALRGFVAGR